MKRICCDDEEDECHISEDLCVKVSLNKSGFFKCLLWGINIGMTVFPAHSTLEYYEEAHIYIDTKKPTKSSLNSLNLFKHSNKFPSQWWKRSKLKQSISNKNWPNFPGK